MKALTRSLFIASLIMSSGTAHAGDIAYRVFVQGDTQSRPEVEITTLTPTDNIIIDVGSIPANTIMYLHVFDVITGDSPDSIGSLQIQGTPLDSNSKLYVLVANESVAWNEIASKFDNPADPQSVGMQNIGGLSFSSEALRDASAVSVSVRGDVLGDVVAGQIFRIESKRQETGNTGGSIIGNIIATKNDWSVSNTNENRRNLSIGIVQADWSIEGDIIASGEGISTYQSTNNETWASANSIIAGTVDGAPGLRGNVDCSFGYIRQVLSGGTIGDGPAASQRSTILAGFRVGRVATVDAGNGNAISESPIYATINTGVRNHASQITNEQSGLSLLQTEGDFVGTIHLHDVYCFSGPDSGGPATSNGRKGIFVGGDFIGDIYVDYSYEYADIVAR